MILRQIVFNFLRSFERSVSHMLLWHTYILLYGVDTYRYTLLPLNITDWIYSTPSTQNSEWNKFSGRIVRLSILVLITPKHLHFSEKKINEKCLRASQIEFTRGNADSKWGEFNHESRPIRFPLIHDIIPLRSTVKR